MNFSNSVGKIKDGKRNESSSLDSGKSGNNEFSQSKPPTNPQSSRSIVITEVANIVEMTSDGPVTFKEPIKSIVRPPVSKLQNCKEKCPKKTRDYLLKKRNHILKTYSNLVKLFEDFKDSDKKIVSQNNGGTSKHNDNIDDKNVSNNRLLEVDNNSKQITSTSDDKLLKSKNKDNDINLLTNNILSKHKSGEENLNDVNTNQRQPLKLQKKNLSEEFSNKKDITKGHLDLCDKKSNSLLYKDFGKTSNNLPSHNLSSMHEISEEDSRSVNANQREPPKLQNLQKKNSSEEFSNKNDKENDCSKLLNKNIIKPNQNLSDNNVLLKHKSGEEDLKDVNTNQREPLKLQKINPLEELSNKNNVINGTLNLCRKKSSTLLNKDFGKTSNNLPSHNLSSMYEISEEDSRSVNANQKEPSKLQKKNPSGEFSNKNDKTNDLLKFYNKHKHLNKNHWFLQGKDYLRNFFSQNKSRKNPNSLLNKDIQKPTHKRKKDNSTIRSGDNFFSNIFNDKEEKIDNHGVSGGGVKSNESNKSTKNSSFFKNLDENMKRKETIIPLENSCSKNISNGDSICSLNDHGNVMEKSNHSSTLFSDKRLSKARYVELHDFSRNDEINKSRIQLISKRKKPKSIFLFKDPSGEKVYFNLGDEDEVLFSSKRRKYL